MVECDVHGSCEETFVCIHILRGLKNETPVGFFWPLSSDQTRPDAWCSACEQARTEAGGDWTDELMKTVQVKLICGGCYDHAKEINLGHV